MSSIEQLDKQMKIQMQYYCKKKLELLFYSQGKHLVTDKRLFNKLNNLPVEKFDGLLLDNVLSSRIYLELLDKFNEEY